MKQFPKQKNAPEEQFSAKEADRKATAIGYLRLLLRIVLITLVGLVVFTKIFLLTQASGNGMFPSVKDGDLILAFRAQRDYTKNDVVVYSSERETAIGRIAALEGDVVTIDDSGILLVNGTEQSGEILYPTYAKQGLTYPYRVPPGTVFLLGDHRTAARDSREFGAVPTEHIKGKVITILRRRGL